MARIVLTSAYTKNVNHVMNYLTYAGEKLEAQTVYFSDGSSQSIDPDTLINFSAYPDIQSVEIRTKEGKTISFSPNEYSLIIKKEETVEQLSPKGYVDYIGNRKGVVKDEMSGLFGMNGSISNARALAQVEELEGNTWWVQILSLKREDAEKVGYDNRSAFESLLRAKAPEIAKMYNISLENLVLYGAYHDKESNPHMHMFFTSKDSREGYIKGKENMKAVTAKEKSMFFNEIYKDDVSYLKTQKNERFSELQQSLRNELRAVTHKNYCVSQDIQQQFQAVADALQGQTGKIVYGYLPPETKRLVDNLLGAMIEKDEHIKRVFEQYTAVQKKFIENYAEKPEIVEAKLQKFKDKILHPGKKDSKELQNIIVRDALMYNQQQTLKNQNNEPEPEIFDVPVCEFSDADIPPVEQGVLPEMQAFSEEELFSEEAAPIGAEREDQSFYEFSDADIPPVEQGVLPEMQAFSEEGLFSEEAAPIDAEREDQSFYEFSDADAPPGAVQTFPDETYDLGETLSSNEASKKKRKKEKKKKQLNRSYHEIVQLAEKGDSSAQYALGKQFRYGSEYVEKDEGMARIYFEKAAKQDHAFAAYSLGKMYTSGELTKDVKLALEYYSIAQMNFESMKNNKLSGYYLSQIQKYYNTLSDDELTQLDLPLDAIEKKPWVCYEKQIIHLSESFMDGNAQARIELQQLAFNPFIAAALMKSDHPKAEYCLGVLGIFQEDVELFAQMTDVYKQAQQLMAENEIEEGVCLLHEEANAGNLFAKFDLGTIYHLGIGQKRNEEQAQKYYKEALDGFDHLKAENKLTGDQLYRIAKMIGKNLGDTISEKMIEYFEASAEKKNQHAQYELGKYYLNPDHQNEEKALGFLQASAEQDNSYALYTLGKYFFEKEKPEIEEVLEYWEKSAKLENQYAQYALGKYFLDSDHRDEEKALELLQASAAQKNQYAQYALGKYYLNTAHEVQDVWGKIGVHNNILSQQQKYEKHTAKAIHYLEASASQGNQYAQYKLGCYFMDSQNMTKGIEYLNQAFEQKSASAAYRLGRCYGQGINPHKALYYYSNAYQWFKKLAEAGDSHSQYMVGLMLSRGLGCTRNDTVARMYFAMAAKQGNKYAKEALQKETNPRDASYAVKHMMSNVLGAMVRMHQNVLLFDRQSDKIGEENKSRLMRQSKLKQKSKLRVKEKQLPLEQY